MAGCNLSSTVSFVGAGMPGLVTKSVEGLSPFLPPTAYGEGDSKHRSSDGDGVVRSKGIYSPPYSEIDLQEIDPDYVTYSGYSRRPRSSEQQKRRKHILIPVANAPKHDVSRAFPRSPPGRPI